MSSGQHFNISTKPTLQSSSLVVGWSEDAGNMGSKVIAYLNQKLKGEEFEEFEPEDFFSLGGVMIKDDLVQFPESKFYAVPRNDLIIFHSNPPRFEWYKFLNSILDVAEHYCKLNELCTIGAMVTMSAHTAPRELLTIVNSSEMKESLNQYDLNKDMDYQTPHSERPTLSSFLLWIAKRRNVPGISIWVTTPFYLVTMGDPQAQRKLLSFLDKRFCLKLDFTDLDEEIRKQNKNLAQARFHSSEIDDYIRRLESNLRLSEEENANMLRQVEELLKKRD